MAQKDKTSTADASIMLGKYWINNNQWGASGASRLAKHLGHLLIRQHHRLGHRLELERRPAR